jgi:phage tail sheath protein FI
MPVVQQGSINTAALLIPDVYVQIQQPPLVINGLPTNLLGIVGTATWGPTNSPVTLGDLRGAVQAFGAPQNRKYDLVTGLWAAALQGANQFAAVRVTDGTDIAASIAVKDITTPTAATGMTVTGKYTGSLGNSIQVTVSAGSAANTNKITVALPGYVPEVFDNIAGTGATFWTNAVSAINNGLTPQRGASNLVVAAIGASTAAPALATYTLTAGTDGATTITGTVLVGQDTTPRKGMYALRNTGCSVGMLTDCDDSTTWAAQVAFALSEGVYMIVTGPAGDTISNAATTKGTVGIDSYGCKVMFGDWVYFNDSINGLTRMISPQGFVAGKISALSPQNSSLNKQLYGIVGTQKSSNSQVYSSADLQALALAGIDVITNPIPAGQKFGARFGHNSSSNFAIHGDNYTRMTNFLAYTLDAAMGLFIGKLQSAQPNDTTRNNVKATIDNFLQTLVSQGMIDSFQTQCDLTNNTPTRIAAGYLQVDVKVRYLSVVEDLVVNLEGGQSVVINRVNTAPAS